ncbi:MAG: hypothetical protein ACOYKE_14170 [Ferruginibacter sp.]
MQLLKKIDQSFIFYLIKFIGVFCLVFYGTKAVIGITAPGGYYIQWIDDYINYPAWLRKSILQASKLLVEIIGYDCQIPDGYKIKFVDGRGVKMVYSCLGYGIMSFWIAFVFANTLHWKKLLQWLLIGLLAIWLLNVIRVSLLLIATNKGWQIPFNIEHHTLFNVLAYLLVFLMMYVYDRRSN